MTRHIRLALCVVCLVLAGAPASLAASGHPQAVNGVLDLPGWDPAKDGPVRLDGEWDFYWNQLLEPQDVGITPVTGVIRVPGAWNRFEASGKGLPGHGYATYRLRVNLQERRDLALRIPLMRSAYRLWVDGRMIAGNGVVGRSRDTTVPQYRPMVVAVPSGNSSLVITVQVANFHHMRGGTWKSLQLGSLEQLQQRRAAGLALQLMMFGGLLVAALYHAGLYILRREDRWLLYSGVLSLLMALRLVVMGEHPETWVFPGLNWELHLKIEYVTLYIGVAIFVLFAHALFPDEIPDRYVRFVGVLGGAFALAALLTETRISSHLVQPFQIIGVPIVLYLLHCLVRAVRRGRSGAWLFLGGMAAVFFAGVHDILYHNNLSPYGDLLPVGLLSLALLQSIALSHRLSLFQHKATRDGLTGLFNYDYFQSRLTELATCSEQGRGVLSVALLDIDYFKQYNDRYGHVAGNRALQEVARAVITSIRVGDCAARYGGEEFVLLFPDTDHQTATQICRRLLTTIEAFGLPRDHVPGLRSFSVSVGVAQYQAGADTPQRLLERADAALYVAKEQRGHIVVSEEQPVG